MARLKKDYAAAMMKTIEQEMFGQDVRRGNTLEDYKQRKQDLIKQLDNVNHFLDLIDKLKYAPKQVVMHRTEGPVIIRDYLVKDFNNIHRGNHPLVDNLPENAEVGYVVVSHDRELAATDADLADYNEASKVLYTDK